MRMLSVLLTLMFVISGCTTKTAINEGPHWETPSYKPAPTIEDYVVSLPDTIKTASSAKEALGVLENNLPLLKPDQLDIMLMELEDFYRSDKEKVMEGFMQANEYHLFELLDNPITEEDIAQLPDETARKLATDAIAGKYKLFAGEGIVVPEVDYRALLDYKSYLSPAMGDYLELMAIESDNKATSDGSIVIPWIQLGERALNVEAYLKSYPGSPRYDRAKGMLWGYLASLFTGASNSSPYASGRELSPEVREAYDNLIELDGNTFTGKLTGEYSQLGIRLADQLPVVEDANNDPFYVEIMKFMDSLEERINVEFQSK